MEKKKVLIIKGSGRKDGYTNRLCDEVQKLLSNDDVKIFDTYKEAVLPCNGCNYCEKNGVCVNHELDEFYKDFETADLIIFASPVYNGTFPGPMKSLIDRFQVYYTGFYAAGKIQQIKKQRKAVFIAAAGRDGEKSFEFMKWQLSCACTILNLKLSKSVLCSYTDTEPKYSEALEELKRSLTDE